MRDSLTKNELIELLPYLTGPEKDELDRLLYPAEIWQPNPGPQTEAYYSEADILGFGGAAGGGKSDLTLGLALTQHTRSVIFRRTGPELREIIDRSHELLGNLLDARYNGQINRWRWNEKSIEFESCQYEDDKRKQRGRPRDLYIFDEATEFSRSQVEFIIGWLRSTRPDQRCRVLLTFNPPDDEAGNWVVEYFLPWIATLHPDHFSHPNPAQPGELRWYAVIEGKETECESGESFEHNGEIIKPMSRTFIPARLKDNPYLSNTNYERVLQSLPEPLRSQVLYGDFGAAASPDPWQVIPTAWVRLAQKRWLERERPDTPLSAVGIDAVRGGQDRLAISCRYDNWFDRVYTRPGVQIEDGPALAGVVWQYLDGKTPGQTMNIDVVGIGSSGYDSLKTMYPDVNPINASEVSSFRDRSGKLKMRNIRAEYYWRFREALDPVTGDDLALPPGNEVVADLCAATWENTAAGIQIESKEEIKKRLGRSPDVGEAILFAHFMPKSKWRSIDFMKV